MRQHIEQTHGIKLSIRAVGKTPVTFAVGGTRHKLSMIATVTNQGKTR
ncbi:MAG: hypothetical protein DID91_2727704790 [Candidatus Nitrotoga sp. MKT]|nr:MAG: hypothetical protein DID91_2727704790 [Candidatus Nitrotoga sp. MKT]